MREDINGYPQLSQDCQKIENIQEQQDLSNVKQDINDYPQINIDNNIIKQKKAKNAIEIKPQTEIIYVTGEGAVDIATRSKLGVVKIGEDLDIDYNGKLSAAVHIENLLQNEVVIFNCGTSTTVI